ncbi:MAG: DNA translocase FtsK [Bacteroidia bacterium]
MVKGAEKNRIFFGTTAIKDFDKKETEKPAKKSKDKKFFKFLADERFIKTSGVFFIVLSLFILLSCISFFGSWQANQSIVQNIGFYDLITIKPDAAKGFMGLIGAWVAFIFVYKGFGIASVAIVPVLFAIGVLLATSVQPIPIGKTLKYSFFAAVWVSIATGFFVKSNYAVFAGSFGYFGSLYLITLFGKVGTFLLLTAYAIAYLIIGFNAKLLIPNFSFLKFGKSNAEEQISENNIEEITTENPTGVAELNPDEFILSEKQPEITIAKSIEPKPHDITLPVIEPIEEDHTTVVTTEPAVTEKLNTESGLILEIQETPEEEPETNSISPAYGTLDSEYDPTLDYSNYQYPTIELLNDYGENKAKVENAELSEKTRMIEDTLKNYGIGIKRISATIGPTVTLYEIIPQDGVRIAKIKNLEDDIALSLAALGIRIIAPIPGRGTIGIEVPNQKPAMVSIRSVLSSPKFVNADMDLPIAFGKTISNEVFVTDLAKMPHLLMAGATGQGKSVGLNVVLASLLYKKHPSQIKFVLVDPKKVELNIYKTIERHFLAKIPGDQEAIITDTKLVIHTLNSLCKEMDERYDLLKDAQVRNLKEYNAKFISRKLPPNDKYNHRFLPYIVVVIDELADLMMTAGKEVEHPIGRLAQLARAIGIHLILATQRPSVNIITGTIKANFPARVAFRVSQKIDSRTILDANGADQLIGKGDMLFSNGNDLIRLQCAFVDTPEVERIAEFIGSQQGKEPYELPEASGGDDEGFEKSEGFDISNRDDLFEEAARMIVVHQQGSTSLLQRRLNLGYNRAGRLIDQLEKAGIVGPFKGSKAREVIVKTEAELEEVLKNL